MTNALIESTSVSVGKADPWIRIITWWRKVRKRRECREEKEGKKGGERRGHGACCSDVAGESRKKGLPKFQMAILLSLVGLCCHNACFPG